MSKGRRSDIDQTARRVKASPSGCCFLSSRAAQHYIFPKEVRSRALESFGASPATARLALVARCRSLSAPRDRLLRAKRGRTAPASPWRDSRFAYQSDFRCSARITISKTTKIKNTQSITRAITDKASITTPHIDLMDDVSLRSIVSTKQG